MEIDIGLFIVFIVVWFSIYGGLHYYIYRKLLPFFAAHKRTLKISLVILASSIFIVELLTHNGFMQLIYPLALITFIWMGLVFLFFFLSGFVDLVSIVLKKVGVIAEENILLSRQRTAVIAGLVGVAGIFGYFSAHTVNVEVVKLQSDKLKHPLKIVQITDLHLGLLSSEKHIDSLVKKINAIEPDIIVSTGDLVDMQLDHIQGLAEQLSLLNATLGKFAVYGNHEVFAGLEQSNQVINKAGFELLSNSGRHLRNNVTIVGVDDPAVSGRFNSDLNDDKKILKPYSNGDYIILLKHQPRVDERSTALFDLQLSGHTHGGQIFPFGLLTKLVYPIGFGLTQYDKNTRVYVSRGAGTWGPPMRIFAKPEVTVFKLMPVIN